MPNSKDARSEAVNLHGFTVEEFRALGFAAFKAEASGAFPRAAQHAAKRIQSGAFLDSGALSKVPRRSLRAFVVAVRPFVASGARQFPQSAAALAKLEAQLEATRGRPAQPALWERRARNAEGAAHKLKRELRRAPTDREIEESMRWPVGVLRKWRHHKPGVFPPAG